MVAGYEAGFHSLVARVTQMLGLQQYFCYIPNAKSAEETVQDSGIDLVDTVMA